MDYGTAERPIRVLIACDHIDHRGALHGGGRQLIELTRALQGGSIEPTVCVLRRESTLGTQLLDEGLPFRFFGDGRFNPVSLPKFVRLIREQKIDVLHLTDFGASTFGRLAAWITGVPTIVQIITHHSRYQPRGFPSYVELTYRGLAPLTSRALAISQTVKDFAIGRMGFAPESVEVLHYPLPEHSFREPSAEEVARVRARHGIGAGDPVIGAVTRFHAVKGMRYLMEAYARVRRTNPATWLLLVGQGPEEKDLRARAEALGVADRVVFAGFQREAHEYVGAFTVAAVPSLEEGLGLTAVESLALGVPVVASDVGGLPEVVRGGLGGLLVPVADAEALAAALDRLLTDASLRRRMSETARLEARRFSLDRYVSRLTEIYRELAQSRRAHVLGPALVAWKQT